MKSFDDYWASRRDPSALEAWNTCAREYQYVLDKEREKNWELRRDLEWSTREIMTLGFSGYDAHKVMQIREKHGITMGGV